MSDENRIGDGPIEASFAELMHAFAITLDEVFNEDLNNKKVGFVLMVFPFGKGGRCNYVSNAQRSDVLKMLKEQVAHFEKDQSE